MLIDLDHNSNLTLGIGATPAKGIIYSKDLFEVSPDRPIDCLKSGYKNLDLIPSNGNLVALDDETPANHQSTMILRQVIQASLQSRYDVIIIDCPASVGYLTLNALTASDLVIIPTQAEFFSSYALQAMFSTIIEIRRKTNPYLKYRILVTLLDLRLREHVNILEQLLKYLGNSIYKTMIMVDTNFRKSHTNGIPINYLEPTTRGSIQYREVAQEIIKDLKEGSSVYREQADHSIEENMVASAHPAWGLINPTPQDAPPTDLNSSLHAQPTQPPQAEPQVKQVNYCSYLGRVEDLQTMLAYPSIGNKCYRAKPMVSPSLNHQDEYCISNRYLSCPLLQAKTPGRLPPHLRAPMDTSDMLQYFKNWIMAKIS